MATATKQDYYEVLGVNRKASADEIRKAYRRLARKHHPDLNPGDKNAEERFKRIQEAYDVLSDPKKRQMYDRVGFYSESGVPPGGGGPGGRGPEFDFSGFDFSDLFGSTGSAGSGAGTRSRAQRPGGFGDNLRDVFSQFFSGRAAQHEVPPAKGEDLEYEVRVGFWESIRGGVTKLTINRYEQCATCGGTGAPATAAGGVCPECNGTGTVTQQAGAMRFQLTCPRCGGAGQTQNVCGTCHGEGRVVRPDTIEVRIPAGTQDGSRLRVAGKGNAGTSGGPAGDLFIIIRVEPHKTFHREGDDIHITVPVTVTEAALGARIEVPTVDGRAMLRIPPGTQSGQRFRLREKGVQSARTGHRGDQYVEVQIRLPEVIDEDSKELYRQLGRFSSDPRRGLFDQT